MEQDMAEDYICQVEEIVQLLATEQHQPHEHLYGSKRQQLRLTVLETVLYRKNSINLQSRRRPEKHFLWFFFFFVLAHFALLLYTTNLLTDFSSQRWT